MKKILFFTFGLLLLNANAQHTPTFDWKHHVSYTEGVDVAPFKEYVYAAFKNGVVQYNMDEYSHEKYTSVNYLSDVDISCIRSDNQKYVLIGYSNGNLDLILDNTFFNLPEIFNGSQSGNKEIKDIYFDGDLAYVSSGIGVILYDLKKKEVREFFKPTETEEVNDATIFNDSIFVTTKNGIYKADRNYPFLADINAWTKLSSLGALNNGDFTQIETTGTDLYAVYNSSDFLSDSLIKIGQTIEGVASVSRFESPKLRYSDGKMTASGYVTVQDVIGLNAEAKLFGYVSGKSPNISNAIWYNNQYFLADTRIGLVRGANTWNNFNVNINSPHKSDVYGLAVSQGRVVVTGGGLYKYTENTYNSSGMYTYQSGSWTNINTENSGLEFGRAFDYSGAAIDPNNENRYFIYGQSGQALVQMNENGYVGSFDPFNSTLDSVPSTSGDDVRIGGAEIDDNGFLWVGNSFSNEPLKILSPDGIWHKRGLSSAINNSIIYDVSIDYFDRKWISSQTGGIVVLDHNRTETDFSDDIIKTISTGEGDLPSNRVFCTRMDFDGEVWIGTGEGLAVIYNGEDVFNEETPVEASRILVQKETDVEILLGTNAIIDIEIDGANRKWVVVEQSGLICLSPDGSEEIYSFNMDNSPLVSNNISDIEIDHITGEIYIATDKGLMSFRADASQSDSEFKDVKVFPNPVLPTYEGSVTVTGLGYNSHVNVTDVAGNLVYETTSNGGTVTWNCKTVNGEKVSTGVYLFWAGRNDEKGRKVAKVMVIN